MIHQGGRQELDAEAIYVRVWEIDMLKKTKVESNVVIKMVAQGRGKALA